MSSAQVQLSAPAPLTADHEILKFDSGEPALDDWLKHRALTNESRYSRTYVICEEWTVVGYYCISAGAVERSAAPRRLRRNAPETVPVSVIGRLAVDRRHSGRGLGADLLADALTRIAVASQSIGIGAVLVHAKSAAAKAFYLRHAEFLEYPADSRTLFLPIETVVSAFSQGANMGEAKRRRAREAGLPTPRPSSRSQSQSFASTSNPCLPRSCQTILAANTDATV